MTDEVAKRLDPELAEIFEKDLDTDWKYVEWLYQAFKARMKIEDELDAYRKSTGGGV